MNSEFIQHPIFKDRFVKKELAHKLFSLEIFYEALTLEIDNFHYVRTVVSSYQSASLENLINQCKQIVSNLICTSKSIDYREYLENARYYRQDVCDSFGKENNPYISEKNGILYDKRIGINPEELGFTPSYVEILDLSLNPFIQGNITDSNDIRFIVYDEVENKTKIKNYLEQLKF